MSPLAESLLPDIVRYLQDVRGLCGAVRPLANGEYNLNYAVETESGTVVVRLSTGAQEIATGDSPIVYEAQALRLLAPTGIAPALVTVDPHPRGLPYGLLIEQFLPGRPLDYTSAADIERAARTLAHLHSFRPAEDPSQTLVVIDDPLATGLFLGKMMLADYRAHPEASPAALAVFERAERGLKRAAERHASLFSSARRCIVHTDVQAHNFIVSDGAPATRRGEDDAEKDVAWLVDWEKPVLDDPSYDLCHFLAVTTTRWKCDIDLDEAQGARFMSTYRAAVASENPSLLDALDERVRIRQPFVYWRALTWSAMAWTQYRERERAIRNDGTASRIESYLEPDLLERVFASVLV